MPEIAGFARSIGLWALLSLIPFIILYLRRPKPKDQIIPSLMFLVKDQKKSKRYSFFRTFVNSLLFLIQLLALAGLAASIAAPFIKLPYDVTLENTVLIIDVSASMQTEENGITRFDNAIKEAKSYLSGRNSIILAENTPLIVLEDESTEVALDVFSKIEPRATTTNIGDSLLLAKDILGENPGRIVVFSDFVPTEGPDIGVVKTAIATDERIVDFVDVSNNAENAGIIKLETNKYNTKIFVKNFDDEDNTINIKIFKEGKEIASSGSIKIAPKSIEPFSFDTVEGIAKIEVAPKDSLAVDNIVYVATPEKLRHSVLLITNEEQSNLELALESARDIELNIVNPPVLTINTKREKIKPFEHDVIIVYRINNVNKKDGILPGTFKDLKNYVEKGGNLVIAVQDDSTEINMEGILPVDLKKLEQSGASICVNSVNEITKIFKIGECFTASVKFFSAEEKKGSVNLGIYASPKESGERINALSLQKIKNGKVVYYGIFDDASDFKTLPSYPIFWNNLVNFLVEAEDIRDFNFKTGKVIVIGKQEVKTPSSSFITSKLLMDEVGIYDYNGKKFAANLIDEKESDVVSLSQVEKQEERKALLEKTQKQRDFNMEFVLLGLVFLLMTVETIYIKSRGDL